MNAEVRHIIIPGLPRCGTSSLYEYLVQHPDIIRPIRKELHYFDTTENPDYCAYRDKLIPHTPERADQLGRDRARHSAGECYTIDATPSYCWTSQRLAERIRRLIPNSYVLLLFRNPVDRLYANFMMNRMQLKRDDWNFENKWHEYAQDSVQQRIASYRMIHENWIDTFGSERVKTIISERFFSSPEKTVQECFSFLGLHNVPTDDLRATVPVTGSVRNYPSMPPHLRERISEYYAHTLATFEKWAEFPTR